jgi:hypothetical protein
MRVALPGRSECPFHGPLSVALIGPTLVRGQRPPLGASRPR